MYEREPYDARSMWERRNDEYRQQTMAENRARAYSRSLQFADYLKDAAAEWPAGVAIPMWIGCVYRWLDHPMAGEEETFAEAEKELERLNDERRRV